MGDTPEYLWIGGHRTAVHDLNTIFRHVRRAGTEDPELLQQELLRRAREHNYISISSGPLYAEALLAAYHTFCGKTGRIRRSARAIRVVGSGCRRCEETARRIRSVCAQLGMTVDLQHVSGLAAAGPTSRPPGLALVIDGAVKPLAGVPSEAELHGLLGAYL